MNGTVSREAEYVAIDAVHARRIRWLLLIAFVLFVAGVIAPMMTISKFVVVTNTFSVLSGVTELFRNGNYILFLVVAGFSVVLPLLKIGVLYRIVARHRRGGADDHADYGSRGAPDGACRINAFRQDICI